MILPARPMPLLTMVEMIRTMMMERLAKRKEEAEKWKGLLCPNIAKTLADTIAKCTRYIIIRTWYT